MKTIITISLLIGCTFLYSQTAEEWKKQGNTALENGDYDQAIGYYQKSIEADSNYFDAFFNLGLTHSYKKEWDKAIDYYTKAISKDETNIDPYLALGDIHTQNEAFDNAILIFKKALRLRPESPEIHANLGFLYEQQGKPVYATRYTKKAAQLGDTLLRQFFIDSEISWEDNFMVPDYTLIKQNIENEQSDFHYTKLWDKYERGDTLMTLDEKHHLYYGYVFNESYSPYAMSPFSEEIKMLLNKEAPTTEEWERLVSLLQSSLIQQPFNCRHLYYQAVAFDALSKPHESEASIGKIRCILDALTSSGDGLLKETAIHVIDVSNEYDYLFMNKFLMRSQSLVGGGFDVLTLEPNMVGIEELWFNVNQSLNFLNSSFDE